MKKLFCFLTVLVLLLSAGCAKKDNSLAGDEGVVEKPVDAPVTDEQETIDVPEDEATAPEASEEEAEEKAESDDSEEQNEEAATPEPEKKTIEELIAEDHPDLAKQTINKDYIIVQAKKLGESIVTNKEELPEGDYGAIKMQMEITKVYRAPFKVGDVFDYWEFNGTYLASGDDLYYNTRCHHLAPLENDTEYLMILQKDETPTASIYRSIYGTDNYAYYTYVAVSEKENIAMRINAGTATQYDQLHYALLEGLVK